MLILPNVILYNRNNKNIYILFSAKKFVKIKNKQKVFEQFLCFFSFNIIILFGIPSAGKAK